MPYAYSDDIAVSDLAFEAWGHTLEETFRAAADATVNAMVENPDGVAPRMKVPLRLEESALDLLLLSFLEELIYYKDARRLFLRVPGLSIREENAGFVLEAEAVGDTIDPAKHDLGADVKGVTLHRLAVEKTRDGWRATVILDV